MQELSALLEFLEHDRRPTPRFPPHHLPRGSVRATGGLDDTIEPWDARSGKGTGFKFTDYSGEALLLTIKQALHAYRDQTSWQVLMRNGMNKDFSWNASAREYGKVYEKVKQMRGAPANSERVLA